jgi:hypothetical protein
VLGEVPVETDALGMSHRKQILVEERGGGGPGNCQRWRWQLKEELFVPMVLWNLRLQGPRQGHRRDDATFLSCARERGGDSKVRNAASFYGGRVPFIYIFT